MENFNLTGRVAIVTGGSKGLGAGMALALARYGADIVVASRNASEGELISKEIREMGRKSIAVAVDVQNVKSINQMVETVQREFGRIDILVNNAGVGSAKPALSITEEDWEHVLNTNLKGLFFCSQAVAKVMKEQNYGKIINISSVAGTIGQNMLASYCASKAGVISLTRTLAKEWSSHNIYVNSIAPSYIKTSLNEAILSNEQFLNNILSQTPLKRLGEIEDLTGALILLASKASNYITGQTIYIDGGALA
ncbi:SDR family NAD(P)-dependent oxidoreductase [Gottfriedia sp. NPDC057991]|uniref:SDR family NAD(P)-dependent oxidoreductase n=1 Tax=Gottfriedia sp. NPDC057991 TaxID=3346298 RepID=UPI0036DB5AC6